MCGRFIIFSEAEEREIKSIVEDINEKYKDSIFKKDAETFPTDISPVITYEGGKKNISLLKWGFPNPKGGPVIINARGETILERPMFREPFASHRCLIPASAFFEWKQVDKKKQKYIIRSSETDLFYMAGLYEGFIDKNGQPFTGFVVITTSASSKMSLIHERMPVILTDKSAIELWVNNGEKDIVKLQRILAPNEDIHIEIA